MFTQNDLVLPPIRRLAAALHRCPKVLLLSLGVGMIALIATADELDGPHVQLALLYSLPIALVTWYVGGIWGALFALFGGITTFAFTVVSLPPQVGLVARTWSLVSNVVSFALVAGLIYSLRKALENQRALANTDELTGIPNTRSFRTAAAIELARAERSGSTLTTLFLDCDNFKLVNDRLGHAAGDRLLRTVASTLANHLRFTDHVARLGGDEFGVLLPGLEPADAQAVVHKLSERLRAAMTDHRWPVTFSIGALTLHRFPDGVDALLARVDQLQYQAKAAGKDRVVYADLTTPRPPTRLAA